MWKYTGFFFLFKHTRNCSLFFLPSLVLYHCFTSTLFILALLTFSVGPILTAVLADICFFSLSYAVIAFGCASCPKITCGREGCGTEFCYHCKQLWHPNQTCDTARQQRAQTFRLRSFRSSSLSYSQESGATGNIQINTVEPSSDTLPFF